MLHVLLRKPDVKNDPHERLDLLNRARESCRRELSGFPALSRMLEARFEQEMDEVTRALLAAERRLGRARRKAELKGERLEGF